MVEETKPHRVRGHVAAILNTRQLALNIGSLNHVEVGMQFDVVHARNHELKDPISGESLGKLELPKKRVKISEVAERYSIASTLAREVNVGGRGLGWDFANIYGPPKWVTRYDTLKKSSASFEEIDESESVVKVGDPVVEVVASGGAESMDLIGEETSGEAHVS